MHHQHLRLVRNGDSNVHTRLPSASPPTAATSCRDALAAVARRVHHPRLLQAARDASSVAGRSIPGKQEMETRGGHSSQNTLLKSALMTSSRLAARRAS